MKWAMIIDVHLNMDLVVSYYWEHSWLKVVPVGGEVLTYYDPDRKLYLKMCRSQGVLPYEEG